MLTIIDYGMGNLRSVLNKLERIDLEVVISSKKEDILRAEKLVLPGVGAFGTGINNLSSAGLIPVLERKVIGERVPLLGICLGMQLLTRRSEEGNVNGLGWLDCDTIKFKFDGVNSSLKVPHMGWNTISKVRENRLLDGIETGSRFYFVHSYHVSCEVENGMIIATTNYGYDFPSVIQKDNIYATQFHPEKSHDAGMRVLTNFATRV